MALKNYIVNNSYTSDILIGCLAIVSLILSSNPVSSYMPSALGMVMIGIFSASFGLFALLIWCEQPRDERESQHLMASDRIGFLAGAGVTSIAVVIQTFRHEPTSILVAILVAMILAKIVGRRLNK